MVRETCSLEVSTYREEKKSKHHNKASACSPLSVQVFFKCCHANILMHFIERALKSIKSNQNPWTMYGGKYGARFREKFHQSSTENEVIFLFLFIRLVIYSLHIQISLTVMQVSCNPVPLWLLQDAGVAVRYTAATPPRATMYRPMQYLQSTLCIPFLDISMSEESGCAHYFLTILPSCKSKLLAHWILSILAVSSARDEATNGNNSFTCLWQVASSLRQSPTKGCCKVFMSLSLCCTTDWR